MSKDELEEYLDALDRHEHYRVDALLKDSPIERTERVYFVGKNGAEQGPFIRKTIASESGQGRAYQKVFRAQQAGQRLAHIPHIHECYSTGASLEVIVEFVEGQTLQEYVEEHGPSRELAARLFPALCDAVSELHEAFDPPIIHRDLTPANIIVSDAGVTVIDLGIAREFHPGARRDTVYFGTRDFAPPEQFGFAQTDVRSDVYAMGKLLRYCLEGPAPAGEGTKQGEAGEHEESPATEHAPGSPQDEAARLHGARKASSPQGATVGSPSAGSASSAPVSDRPSSVPATSDQVDRQLQEVIAKATGFDPEKRYASARELKRSFLDALTPADAPGSNAAKRSRRTQLAPPAPTGAPVIAMPTPSDPSSFLARLSKVAGSIWSAFVLVIWVITLVTSVEMTVSPDSTFATLPLWARLLEIYGIGFIPLTIAAYFVIDLRLLREKLPELKLPSRRKTWPIALGIILALWAAVYLIVYLTHL